MKKLLSLLAVTGLITTTTVTVVACDGRGLGGGDNNNPDPENPNPPNTSKTPRITDESYDYSKNNIEEWDKWINLLEEENKDYKWTIDKIKNDEGFDELTEDEKAKATYPLQIYIDWFDLEISWSQLNIDSINNSYIYQENLIPEENLTNYEWLNDRHKIGQKTYDNTDKFMTFIDAYIQKSEEWNSGLSEIPLWNNLKDFWKTRRQTLFNWKNYLYDLMREIEKSSM